MNVDALQYHYRLTQQVFARNLDGIDDAAALKRPSSGANGVNWIVGHVAQARLESLQLLDRPAIAEAQALAVYQARKSESFTDEQALPLSRLRALMVELHDGLLTALAGIPADRLARPVPFSPLDNPDETVGSLLTALAFHEAYHCGQIGVLRRDLGLAGAIRGPGQAPR